MKTAGFASRIHKFWPEYFQSVIVAGIFLVLVFSPARYSDAYGSTGDVPVSDYWVALRSIYSFCVGCVVESLRDFSISDTGFLMTHFLGWVLRWAWTFVPYLLWRLKWRRASFFMAIFNVSLLGLLVYALAND